MTNAILIPLDKNLNQNRKKILGQKAWPYPFQIAKPVLILKIILLNIHIKFRLSFTFFPVYETII